MAGFHPGSALALRRALVVGAAALATLVAHGLAHGHPPQTLHAGVVLGTAVSASLLIGRRAGDFVPRSASLTALILVLVQAAAHTTMWAAPWAFGFGAHQEVGLVTAGALLTHLCAALVLAPVIARVEQILAVAVHGMRRLRRLMTARASVAARCESVPGRRHHRARHPFIRATPARGPPRIVSPV